MAQSLRPLLHLLALTCVLITSSLIQATTAQVQTPHSSQTIRKLLSNINTPHPHQEQQADNAHDLPIKIKPPSSLKKNQTTKSETQTAKKIILKHGSKTNQTKSLLNLNSTNLSPKNKTTLPKKLNSTSKPTSLKSKPIVHHEEPMIQKPIQPIWVDVQVTDDDLISEFTDLPSRFQETLLPDLEKISSTSKVYLKKANKEITNGVKPIVGKKYAPAIASLVSCAFIIIPFVLVSLVFNRFKSYFSLQKLLIFIQIYLYIYFSILSVSGLATGLEPLGFFYAASPTIYVCVQAVQTLAYVLYTLLLLMYVVFVFSVDTGLGLKVLSLGQTFVGFAVGLHYYVTVSHRAVLRQLPKTSWRVQAVYATCFFVVCMLDRAERRKKAYLEANGLEGKKC